MVAFPPNPRRLGKSRNAADTVTSNGAIRASKDAIVSLTDGQVFLKEKKSRENARSSAMREELTSSGMS